MARTYSTRDPFSLDPKIVARFWQHVTRCAHGEPCATCCWLWRGPQTKHVHGNLIYGRFYIHPSYRPAHRVAYVLTYGSIFPGLYICHRCDVPLCVNPQHLWLGTPTDNVHDAMRKGRARSFPSEAHKQLLVEHPEYVPKGEQVGTAKLTESQVLAIRRAYKHNHSLMQLAAQFGVHKATIGHIVYRITWRHLPEE